MSQTISLTTIILCGGAGTRLWPLSRKALPKQFAALLPGGSLFQGAVRRALALGSRVMVAANEGQSSVSAEQLAALGVREYGSMVEPVGRNTAPAIALACMALDPGEVVLVAPSDHLIRGLPEYLAAATRGTELAKQGRIVTFGIAPAYAETGYGYIEADGEAVRSFKEKPDAATAARYVASGRYYWNSGMFCFMAGTFLSELERHAPEVRGLQGGLRTRSREGAAPAHGRRHGHHPVHQRRLRGDGEERPRLLRALPVEHGLERPGQLRRALRRALSPNRGRRINRGTEL